MSTPEHYRGKTDVIERIRMKDGVKQAIAFCINNVNKYATRVWRKNTPEEDIGKIIVYASRALELLKTNEKLLSAYTKEVMSNISYLREHIGIKSTISYMQGKIIELSNMRKDSYNDSSFKTDLELSVDFYLILMFAKMIKEDFAELSKSDSPQGNIGLKTIDNYLKG